MEVSKPARRSQAPECVNPRVENRAKNSSRPRVFSSRMTPLTMSVNSEIGHHRWLRLKSLNGKPTGQIMPPAWINMTQSFHRRLHARLPLFQRERKELCALLQSHSTQTNRKAIAIMRRSCSDSLLTAGDLGRKAEILVRRQQSRGSGAIPPCKHRSADLRRLGWDISALR
jgi:hypothetical protein